LRGRREEIEAATSTRVLAVSGLPAAVGPEYEQGLRRAVSAGLEYGLASLDRDESAGPTPPPVLLGQAAFAARSGVGLDTVLRRYVAGHAILGDFVIEEDGGRLPPGDRQRALRRLAAALDRLVPAVSEAYVEGSESLRGGAERRRSALIERLLAGEPVVASVLGYGLGDHHLGLVIGGERAADLLSSLARGLDARLLTVSREEDLCWAWLGRRGPLDPSEVCDLAAAHLPARTAVALGEPAEGLGGWRLTHRQARAAFPLASLRAGDPIVRYADVAFLAAALHDDLFATSLRRLYLEPLEAGRDGGAALRQTLRAYFEAGRNVSSAAVSLGVKRHTVTNRLRVVEDSLGRSLDGCMAELETALRLADLEPTSAIGSSPRPYAPSSRPSVGA
jgi:hypothetical protein